MVAIIVVIELALFEISFASKLVSNRQLYNYSVLKLMNHIKTL